MNRDNGGDIDLDLAPVAVQPAQTANASLEAWAKANVAARFALAAQRPRDTDVVRDRLLHECRRPSFALVARWAIPNRGNGWSIRFAEAALRLWGNCGVDPLLIYEDSERRVLSVTVTDYESNLTYGRPVVVPKVVERHEVKKGQVVRGVRTNSAGVRVYVIEATDQEMAQRLGAELSKALRAEALRMIPGDILDEANRLVRETLTAESARDPDAARKAVLDSFAGLGVSPAALKAHIGKEIKACSPAELSDLRELYVAIRDGHTTWQEATAQAREAEEPPPPRQKAEDRVLSRLGADKTPPKAPEPPAPAPVAEPEPPPSASEPSEPSVDPGGSQGLPGMEPARARPPRTKAPPAATERLPLGLDLDVHRAEAAPLFTSLSLPPWDRWTAQRQGAVARAMERVGTTSPSSFWAGISEFAVHGLTDEEYGGLRTMEDLLELYPRR